MIRTTITMIAMAGIAIPVMAAENKNTDPVSLLSGLTQTQTQSGKPTAIKYTCPMHPQVISDTLGKCPICGMDLVPLQGGHDHSASSPEGAPVIEIATGTIQKMGVRAEKATKGSLTDGVRATGTVMVNERESQTIFSQVEGKVNELKVAPGESVQKGALFYTLTSESLFDLQRDYVIAVNRGSNSEVHSLARQMALQGIDEGYIAKLTESRQPFAASPKISSEVPFLVPATGVLTKLDIRNGTYIKVNDPIGTIQDLSSVWVEAAIPEKDASRVKVGSKAVITLNGVTKSYHANVDYIYPEINPESRTVRVRLPVENKGGMLKPGGYVTVELDTAPASSKLTIPSEAVLLDAEGAHVIIALGEGKFQARNIGTGRVNAGRTEILSGLSEGEEVVTSSQFLIDSESNLREALNKLSSGDSNAK